MNFVVFEVYLNKNIKKTPCIKQSHIQLHQKRIKYLGINLAKERNNLYTENYMTLRKEIEAETNKWRYSKLMDWNDWYC